MSEPAVSIEEARAAIARLAIELGVDFMVARRLIDALVLDDSGLLTASTLVETTGIPHRRVLELLRALGIEAVKGLIEVPLVTRRALQAGLMNAVPQHPRPSPDLLSAIAPLAAALPPPAGSLDHVPAIPETIVRRAEYLRETYELEGAHVVCLGDHDLTSVATALVAPGAIVSAVDIDERVLRFLGTASDRLGLDLRLSCADLRLGLPRTLRGVADLVFTDPPYSEEGVALFVDRAVEALADRPGARILFCYGASDRGGEQLLAIQEVLMRRHLVLELLAPGFNRYRGAHAIGATSALWVCRPTRRTRPAVARQLADRRSGGRIYSRGAASREGRGESLDAAVLEQVAQALHGAETVLLAGDGWDGFEPGPPVANQTLGELLDAATQLPALRGAGVRAPADAVAINLHPFYGDSLVRVLLAVPPAGRIVVVALRRSLAALGDERRAFVEARWVIGGPAPVGAGGAGGPAVLVAEPASADAASPTAFLLRYLQEHQAALVRNAWREGLIQLASRQALSVTKNQARGLIDAVSSEAGLLRPAELDSHLLELPADALARLAAAVQTTTERVTQPLAPEG